LGRAPSRLARRRRAWVVRRRAWAGGGAGRGESGEQLLTEAEDEALELLAPYDDATLRANLG
jgi:hypothetical protein